MYKTERGYSIVIFVVAAKVSHVAEAETEEKKKGRTRTARKANEVMIND